MRGGKHHGNTLMPQPIVNLGRNIAYQGENLWNNFAGNPSAVNPDPYLLVNLFWCWYQYGQILFVAETIIV